MDQVRHSIKEKFGKFSLKQFERESGVISGQDDELIKSPKKPSVLETQKSFASLSTYSKKKIKSKQKNTRRRRIGRSRRRNRRR